MGVGKYMETQIPPNLLGLEQIMELEGRDDCTFSLKVITAAYCIVMQEYGSGAISQESYELLQSCAEHIMQGCGLVFIEEKPGRSRLGRGGRREKHHGAR